MKAGTFAPGTQVGRTFSECRVTIQRLGSQQLSHHGVVVSGPKARVPSIRSQSVAAEQQALVAFARVVLG